MDKLVEKCLPDSVMNRLRKIIFDVLYKNPPYNQGIIASEILEQAIPIIREEIKKELEEKFGYFLDNGELAKLIVDDGGYYGHEGSLKEWKDYWRG